MLKVFGAMTMFLETERRKNNVPRFVFGIVISLVTLGQACANDDTLPSVEIRFAPNRDGSTDEKEIPDLQRHVMPMIGKLGCNSRHCHGSFQGRGGLVLSLFGYDFKKDHAALTGRSSSGSSQRIDHNEPAQSLILGKATELVDHEGGQRFAADSWEYEVLKRWIAAGAPKPEQAVKLKSLQVTPTSLDWEKLNSPRSLKVIAHWADGHKEDVTPLSRFRSNDDAVVKVRSDGQLEATGYGDTHVIVFYDNGVHAVPARVVSPNRPALPWPQDPVETKVDQLVNRQLRSLGIVPSGICSDHEFLRRVCIDLTGTLPPPEEVRRFIKDKSQGKRLRKIEELLERPAFAAWWATKLCDFTGCNPQQQAELGQHLAEQWYMWIYQRLLEKAPYDEIVEGIFLANSRKPNESSEDYHQRVSGFFKNEDPIDFTANESMPHFWSRTNIKTPQAKGLAVAHSFLGIRLQCAECHKHPWDQWTQADFRQFSEFFSPIQYGVPAQDFDVYQRLAQKTGVQVKGKEGSPIRDEQMVKASKGQVVPWREVYVKSSAKETNLNLLQSQQITLAPGEDPRRQVMDWFRDKKNPWFARAIVNRVWASCFHKGIVHPPDDLNPANPPSNPELLDWLSAEFIKQDYDLRWLLKEITRSATWQRSCRANPTNSNDQRHFSRAIPRRIPAEVVYDGIKQAVCGSKQHQSVREDLTRRAVGHLSMRMAGTYAMQVFGKPQRSAACDCERVNEPSLLQAVFLQNDPLVHLLLEDSLWLKEIGAKENVDSGQLKKWIQEAWLRCVSREPTDKELNRAFEHVSSAKTPREGIEDLLWSLINTREFLLNH